MSSEFFIESFAIFRDNAEREFWTMDRALREAHEWKDQAMRVGSALMQSDQSMGTLRSINDALAKVVQRHGLTDELKDALARYVQARSAELPAAHETIRQAVKKHTELKIQGRQRKAAQNPRRKNPIRANVIRAMRKARRCGCTLNEFIESGTNDSGDDAVLIERTVTHGVERLEISGCGDEFKVVNRATLKDWWAESGRD